MQQLNYNLTVHNPFRPVEGLMIDIKVHLQYLYISVSSIVLMYLIELIYF